MIHTTPSWNLNDLYTDPKDPNIQKDRDLVQTHTREFCRTYEGKIQEISSSELEQAIQRYEQIQEILGKLMTYGFLRYATDNSNEENINFFQSLQEFAVDILTPLIFFTLEINDLSPEKFDQVLKAITKQSYKSWLEKVRLFKAHQLDKKEEQILAEKYIVSQANWSRLFDETFARLRFSVDGQELCESDVLDRFTNPDPKVRETAAKAFAKGLGDNIHLFSLITNTLAKNKEVEDRLRGYANPISSRNLENQVEDTVVDVLASTVKEMYPQLSHRYYKLKAKWLGMERLNYWDRSAPLVIAEETPIAWEEAKDIVLTAYQKFSPSMAAIGRDFFDKQWIDAGLNPGKNSGAFSHPGVPSVHPYILLNYHGKIRDVMTLAHELGHGVHQILSADQGYLGANTPLTVAETASVFGEMLTFQSLLAKETNPLRKRNLLASKVEDMLSTTVRQIAFHEFEREVHNARKVGELSVHRLGEIWMNNQKTALGPIFDLSPEYANYWSYVPHFIHSPFYVYAYAFGDCLVNSLYTLYQEGYPEFEAKYINLLKAGGTLKYTDLLKPFDLNPQESTFWTKGLKVIEGFIDDLEKMPV